MNSKDHWNNRYAGGGNSGYGSYGEQADLKLKIIKEHVRNIESVVDIGCGDFAFSKRLLELFPKAQYLGLDISEVIVKKNKELYPSYHFNTLEGGFILPRDLVLCIDVLFHIPTEEDQLLSSIDASWNKYLVLTADDRVNDVSRFGKPLVKELIEGKDVFLYIFKK